MNGSLRWLGFFACLALTLDCIGKAGGEPSVLFAPDWRWLWWIAAAFWALGAIRFLRAPS